MEARWRAEDIKKASKLSFLLILVLTAAAYLLLGCSRDWVVIAGLAVDGIGAVLIAAPDLGFFRRLTYSGELRNVLDELSGRRDRVILKRNDWYDVFLEEMKDILSVTDVPDTAEFRIERSRNSNLMWYSPDPGNQDETAVNLFNVFTPFRNKIDEEEKLVRRYGAYLFVAGIVLQILGLLVNRIILPGLFC